jgi:hypothetical protein
MPGMRALKEGSILHQHQIIMISISTHGGGIWNHDEETQIEEVDHPRGTC